MTTPWCGTTPLPAFDELTAAQARGHACVSCGDPIGPGAVYRGVVLGHEGGLLLDADVWACGASEDSP